MIISPISLKLFRKYFITALFLAASPAAFAECNNLFDCIQSNDTTTLEKLLKAGANPNATNNFGNTPLNVAAFYGRREACGMLIRFGAVVDSVNPQGQTPLIAASSDYGSLETVSFLLQAGANPNHRMSNGDTAINRAAWYGHTTVVEKLLQYRANPAFKNSLNYTALYSAIERNRPSTALVLARTGIAINDADDRGTTPLHLASAKGMTELVTLMLEKGADPKLVSSSYATALHSAAMNGHLAIARALVAKGADPLAATSQGATALHQVAYGNHTEFVSYLLSLNVNINAVNNYGQTPFHMAVLGNAQEAARLLKDNQANINLADKSGITPLMSAVSQHKTIAASLIEWGADVNLLNKDKNSAIYFALIANNQSILERLIAARATLDMDNKSGISPLIEAILRRQMPSVQKIVQAGANVNLITSTKATALCAAIDQDQVEIFHYLLANKASARVPCYNSSALHISLQRTSNLNFLKTLLEHNPDLEAIDAQSYTPLLVAISGRKREALQMLMSKGANVNATTRDRKTALRVAAEVYPDHSTEAIFRDLLTSAQINLNAHVDAYQNTILHYLVTSRQENQMSLLHALLAKEPNLEVRNSAGETPLLSAVNFNYVKSLDLLLVIGANPNAMIPESHTALTLALDRRNTESIQLLLKSSRVNVNLKNGHGLAPLSYAINESNLNQWIAPLIEKGAQLTATIRWAAPESTHTWRLSGIEKEIIPNKPNGQGTQLLYIETDPAIDISIKAQVEVRNLYNNTQKVWTQDLEQHFHRGISQNYIKISDLYSQTDSKINENALSAKVILDIAGRKFSAESPKLLHIFEHLPIVFLPGIFGSRLWADFDNPHYHDDYPDFPILPIPGFGHGDFLRLLCNADGTPQMEAKKIDLFRNFGPTGIYNEVDNREEVSFPPFYKTLYALPAGVSTLDPQYRVPYFKVIPWPYDWRKRLEEAVRVLMVGDRNRRADEPIMEPYKIPPSIPQIQEHLRKNPVYGRYVSDQVSIGGHSTGGLIVRGLIKNSWAKRYIRHAFFVNTPFFGAPKAYYVFFTGDMGIPITPKGQMRRMAPNCPIVQYLSPTQSYKGTVFNNPNYIERHKYTFATEFMPAIIEKARAAGAYPAATEIDPWNEKLDQDAHAYHSRILGEPSIGWENSTVFWSHNLTGDPTIGTLYLDGNEMKYSSDYGDETVPLFSQKGDFPENRLVEILSRPTHVRSPNEAQVWQTLIQNLRAK